MNLKVPLSELNGWQRVMAVVTFIWIIVSSLLYRDGVDRDFSYGDVSLSPKHKPATYDYRPSWVGTWDRNVAGLFGLPYLYNEKSNYMELPNYFGTKINVFDHFNTAFRLEGYLTFVFLPIITIWGLYFVLRWVSRGFREAKH